MRNSTQKYIQRKCENVNLEEINLPQDHKWLLGQEQKQHGKDFYGFDEAAQGRLASRSKQNKNRLCSDENYNMDNLKIIIFSTLKIK